jgi:Cache domain
MSGEQSCSHQQGGSHETRCTMGCAGRRLRLSRIIWDCSTGIFATISTSVRASKTGRSAGQQGRRADREKWKSDLSEFRKKDSEWFHGDTYLFVYDLKSNVLLNAAFPAREGTNTTGQRDAEGKLFHHEFITMAETKGSGWVDYMFPKPGQTQPSRKWAFVKAVQVDGVPSLVASGFYPE